jgi:protein TonB
VYAVAFSVLAAAPAPAHQASVADEQPITPGREISDPVWRSTPTAREMSRYYPGRAMGHEKIGVAVVQCTADAKGALSACRLVCETPTGWEFGSAALGLAREFRLQPRTADGLSVEGRFVTLPLYFNPPA